MPYIFVRSTVSTTDVEQVFGRQTTYIDLDQNTSPVLTSTQLARLQLTPANVLTAAWRTYQTNAPAYAVLNALETCGYKVVAASSIQIGILAIQYVWTLQG